MAFTERLRLIIDADGAGAIRELKAVGSTAQREVGRVENTSAKVSSTLTTIGVAAMTAGGAVAAGLWKASQAASDLSEASSKAGVIFGRSSTEIDQFAANAAAKLGMSKREALDAASTFATFGKAAGLTGADLTGFSTKLATLGADLASFFNTAPEDAVTAIGAALRGESEPIRRYGVLLNEATLRNEAFKAGLIASTAQALTPQQRTLAAYRVILQQTSDAQGDFARTSDGMANSQKIATAQFNDALANFGEAAQPAFTELLRGLGSVLGMFNDLDPATQKLIGTFATTAAVVGVGGGALSFAAGQATTLLGAFNRLLTTLPGVTAGLSGVQGAVVALGAVGWGYAFSENSAQYERGVTSVLVSNDKLAAALSSDPTSKVINKDITQGLMVLAEQMEVGANSATDKIRDLMGVYDDAGARADAAARQMESFKAAIKALPADQAHAMVAKLAQQMGYMGIEADTAQRIVSELNSVITETPRVAGDAAAGLGAAGDAAKGFAEQVADARSVVTGAVDAQSALADARDRSADAEAKLADLWRTGGTRSRAYADAVRSLGDANDRLRDSLDGARTAQEKLAKAQAAITGETDPMRRALAKAAVDNAEADFAAAQQAMRGLDPQLDAERYRRAAQQLQDAADRRRDARKKLTAVDPTTDPNRYMALLDDLQGAQRNMARSERDVAKSRQAVGDAQEKVTEESKRGTIGSREYADAVKAVESAHRNEVTAAFAAKDATDRLNAALAENPGIAAQVLDAGRALVDQGLLGASAFGQWAASVGALESALTHLAAAKVAANDSGIPAGLPGSTKLGPPDPALVPAGLPGSSKLGPPAPAQLPAGTPGASRLGPVAPSGMTSVPLGTWGLPLQPQADEVFTDPHGVRWHYNATTRQWIRYSSGLAMGGPTIANTMHRVGERGPELLVEGGRNFLIPGENGRVMPQVRSVDGGDLTSRIAAAVAAAVAENGERKNVTINNHGVTSPEATAAATLRALRRSDFLTGVGPR